MRNLTLTRVVFEITKIFSKNNRRCYLTLTRVVFENGQIQ